jgi:hypothetical protein
MFIGFEPMLIPDPTDAKPGSDEKIVVLRSRLELGLQLYHPGDETQIVREETKRDIKRLRQKQDEWDRSHKRGARV